MLWTKGTEIHTASLGQMVKSHMHIVLGNYNTPVCVCVYVSVCMCVCVCEICTFPTANMFLCFRYDSQGLAQHSSQKSW